MKPTAKVGDRIRIHTLPWSGDLPYWATQREYRVREVTADPKMLGDNGAWDVSAWWVRTDPPIVGGEVAHPHDSWVHWEFFDVIPSVPEEGYL